MTDQLPSKETLEFIKKAKLKHGDKYDYTNSVYERYRKKVNIICEKHGPFSQTVANHLRGRGCIECGHEKMGKIISHTTTKFIEKAKQKHGDK